MGGRGGERVSGLGVERNSPVYTLINAFQVQNSRLCWLISYCTLSYLNEGSMRKSQGNGAQCKGRDKRSR
jgi:hypothetical protein